MSERFNVADIFGENVFNDTVMKERLPKNVYKNLKLTMEGVQELSLADADVIANAMKDAVFGDEKHRQAILEMITQDMANFLFDDVYTVGKKMANKGATLIHLMNLDGIYIPMSYLLLLLAEAFEEGNKRNYKDIFYPTIKYPSILYPTGGEGHEDENVWTYEDWKRQREDALDKIVISAHFARSLDEIVKELVGK